MNFDQAINAHLEWKTKLLKYIESPDYSLKPSVVSSDKLCQLGQWIVQTAGSYGQIPEYKRLVCDHAVFHRHAGQIVDNVNKGEHVTENDITHPDSAYNIASRNVIQAIMAVRRKVVADDASDSCVVTSKLPSCDQHSASQKFLSKLAETSPEVLELIERTATEETIEIIKLIGTYNAKYALPPAMTNILLDSVRNACTEMLMGISDICKRKGR
ncbi:MAG: CZB domain-containing protein [Bdellovibrionales bacterium]